MLIYYPINVECPITTKKVINLQNNTYNGFPEILIELHDNFGFVDIGDSCVVSAAVTNTDNKTTPFTGNIKIVNPHRGRVQLKPVAKDFTMTGINTVTVRFVLPTYSFSIQFTVFVQSLAEDVVQSLSGGSTAGTISAEDISYNNDESGLQANNVQDAIDELKAMQKDLHTSQITVTLLAENWSNKVYTINSPEIKAESDVFVVIPENIAIEQYNAIAYANLIPAGQGSGYVILTALRDVPTIDITLNLVIKTFE